MHPNIFHMQFSTGAPPDYFDANGQNWGFPTYNWEEMAKDGYEWWRRRLTTMSQWVSVPPSMSYAAKLHPGLTFLNAATLCSRQVGMLLPSHVSHAGWRAEVFHCIHAGTSMHIG